MNKAIWKTPFVSRMSGGLLSAVLTLTTAFTAMANELPETPQHIGIQMISNVNIVDATGRPTLLRQNVIIEDNIIKRIGPADKVSAPASAEVIDAAGKYLIPGLWDMHTHVTDYHTMTEGHEQVMLPLHIVNGVVGVRDMMGYWDVVTQYRANVKSGTTIGPRIYATSKALNLFALGDNFIAVTTAEEAKQAVKDLHAQGVDFIKVHSDLTREPFDAIVEQSKALGLDVVGHVPRAIDLNDIIGDMRSLEHFTGVMFKGGTEDVHYLVGEPYSKGQQKWLFAKLGKHKIYQVPTHTFAPGVINGTNMHRDPHDHRLQFTPKAWTEQVWEPILYYIGLLRTPEDEQQAKRDLVIQRRTISRPMIDAGVPFMAGTDTGMPYVIPGFSLHEELVYMVMSGMTTMEALAGGHHQPGQIYENG